MSGLTSSSGTVRIAVLVPSTFLLDREICEIASQRKAEAHIFRVSPKFLADPEDPESVADMVEGMGSLESLSRAASQVTDVMPHVIAWACTSGSFLGDGGSGQAQAQVMSKHAGGIPATTTSLAMLAAARRLEARKLYVITPYHAEIGIKFVDLLESNDFDVLGHSHAGLGSDSEVGKLGVNDFESLARRAPGLSCDAVVIPCTAVRDQGLTSNLTAKLNCPIITANSATVDHAVALANNAVEGFPKRT